MHEDDLTYCQRRLREESARALATDKSELKAYHGQLARLYRMRLDQMRQGEPQEQARPTLVAAP